MIQDLRRFGGASTGSASTKVKHEKASRQIDEAPRISSNWVEAERLRRHAGGNCLCMVSKRKAPASVIAAVVLTVVLALLIGGTLSFFGFSEGDTEPAIGGLVIGALLLALAWRLVRGGRGARMGRRGRHGGGRSWLLSDAGPCDGHFARPGPGPDRAAPSAGQRPRVLQTEPKLPGRALIGADCVSPVRRGIAGMAFDRQSLIGEPPQHRLVLVRVAVSVEQWEATRHRAGSLGRILREEVLPEGRHHARRLVGLIVVAPVQHDLRRTVDRRSNCGVLA